ncbi:MAG TPA: YfhO family protein [Candidatus Cloacimonadota bacterium]|nr:YfhO family protein [Candidatus Cloacimonadota bacterium]
MKQKKPESKRIPVTATKTPFTIPTRYQHIIFIGILFILLSGLFYGVAFKGYVPQANDTIQWRAQAQPLIEYNKTHKDQALWDPNMFGGMPGYLVSLPNKYPFIENITRVIDHVMNWRIFMLFMGAVGFYLLMIFLGFEPFVAFITTLGFAFISHWAGLVEIGHNTKFRAIMYIPWLFYSIAYARKRHNLLSFGLLSMFLIAQLRENHPQITYYTLLFMGLYWVFSFFMPNRKDLSNPASVREETLGKKNITVFIIFTVILLLSLLVSAMAVSNPLMSTYEYGNYTIRGGSTGLEKSYAQGWSFHPLEIISMAIPNFFGGVGETYWGWMDFTQIYNYMGIIILLFAFIAVFKSKNRMVTFLTIATIILTFMSFGKFFNALSDLLLKYLPGFNKFRVPATILVMVQITFAILAGYGIRTVLERQKAEDQKFLKGISLAFYITIGLLIIVQLAGKSIFHGLKFASPAELEQYKLSDLKDMRALRLDMLVKSTSNSLLLLLGGLGLIWAYMKKQLPKMGFLVLLAILFFVDMYRVDSDFLKPINLQPAADQEVLFEKTPTDDFLLQDHSLYRIFPLNTQIKGRWAYYHQTIEGYHGAKLKRYQEVLDNCLYALLKEGKINWNVIDMLNVKYVLFEQMLPFPNLKPVYQSEQEKLYTFENMTALPRAWFVKNLIVEKDPKKIWSILNSPTFNPATTAIVEESVKGTEDTDKTIVNLKKFDLQDMSYDLYTDKPSFLTVSEIYYPAGWNAYIDGKKTPIYATDYILRGVVVPAGNHILEMKFEPESYKISLKLSLIGILISLLAVIAGFILVFRKKLQS